MPPSCVALPFRHSTIVIPTGEAVSFAASEWDRGNISGLLPSLSRSRPGADRSNLRAGLSCCSPPDLSSRLTNFLLPSSHNATCHPERSGPSLSSAPHSGASGRALEGSLPCFDQGTFDCSWDSLRLPISLIRSLIFEPSQFSTSSYPFLLDINLSPAYSYLRSEVSTMSASSDFEPHPSRPRGKRRHSTATPPHFLAAVATSVIVGAFTSG